ncbi:MAG: ergothioneine biosynthesis protein EgtB [Acidobacteriota bacterium]|nr:ergothioneine biosynthesis protein EgtB [Acidobacteriota bacterium]
MHPISAAPNATADLLARYQAVRAATLQFCRPLTPEDMMVQSCPEASPVKWHLAHTSWFFETFILREFVSAYQPFHAEFPWLFNSYYNALGDMPEKRLRASFSRPSLEAILSYRAHVDEAMARLLQLSVEDEAERRIVLGLQHEQQHLELIATDIKHALFTNPLRPAYQESMPALAPVLPAPLQQWETFAGGLVSIGAAPESTTPHGFAFDNETPRHQYFLQPYSLATRLVTCAEYLHFIEEGGYQRPELWLAEGWQEMRAEGWQAPLYWQRQPRSSSGWSVYTLRGTQLLDDLSETPVCHISFFEADAFARWAGHRLPTEFEWEHAAAALQPLAASNCLESGLLHPARASVAPGLQQMFGEAWEWTQSAYLGYPGYKPLPGALGEYNGKFMSSQMVLRGGSCATPITHLRATYRNFFAPATRWQIAGLRLATDGAR